MATKKKLLQAAAGAAGGAGLNVEEVFSTYLYDGNSSTQTITNGIDLDGEGGLVWCKKRNDSTSHGLFDTERGATKQLDSSVTTAQETQNGGLTSFNSNGFTVGNSNVVNGGEQVSWTFRKAPKFFDVVTYTGTGSAQNISHNLGSVPACIITKRTDASENWLTYHRGLDASAPENKYVMLNKTNAVQSASTIWNDTAPTSTQFTVGSANTNTSGGTYVAYLFAHNDGDGTFGPTGDQDIIKCGSYTGTGSEMFIDLGFEPQWILTRRTDTTDNWFMVDTMRGIVSDGGEDYLWANTSNAEQATTAGWAVNPTGFTIESSSRYVSGGTYIYIAIRRGPMAVPTDATEVFDVDLSSSTTATLLSGFSSDAALAKDRAGGGASGYGSDLFSRLTGDFTKLNTTTTDAETSNSSTISFEQDGIKLNGGTVYSSGFAYYQWKRAPSFCDIVAYTGNGTAGRTVSHNLGVAPEMIWVKLRDGNLDWAVYHKDLYNGRLWLNDTNAYNASSMWNNTLADADNFTVGSTSNTNLANRPFIAYLFASLDGVSKVGSFTGNGTTINIDCGFSSGARFVMTKRTDAGSDWVVWDAARGIVAGNDPYLVFNDINAENSSYDSIDPYSSGFSLNYDGVATNISGASYIFYAVA